MATSKVHKRLIAALRELADPKAVAEVSRFFHADTNGHSGDNKVLGVSIGSIFPVAKRFVEMPLDEIELLLESPYYEVRMGAVSVMDSRRGRRASRQGSARRSLSCTSGGTTGSTTGTWWTGQRRMWLGGTSRTGRGMCCMSW